MKKIVLAVIALLTVCTVWAGDFEDMEQAYARHDYATYEIALQNLRKTAIEGDVSKQVQLGEIYSHIRSGQGGNIILPDYVEAFKWYQVAATQGNAKAQQTLGMMYKEGKSSLEKLLYGSGQAVIESDIEAAKWYKVAAAQGDANSQYYLGWLYEHGEGVVQDYVEAVRWYKLAVEQGDSAPQRQLALMYRNGKGVKRDYVRAHMWFNLSEARSGNAFYAIDRDDVASLMSPSQIDKAQKMARDCQARNFKRCD